VGSLGDSRDEKAYWLSKTPLERLEALEFLRQTFYGYDPLIDRVQRVLEVVDLESDRRCQRQKPPKKRRNRNMNRG
jgi:hypothetical protein